MAQTTSYVQKQQSKNHKKMKRAVPAHTGTDPLTHTPTRSTYTAHIRISNSTHPTSGAHTNSSVRRCKNGES